jgi:hypothetical protein
MPAYFTINQPVSFTKGNSDFSLWTTWRASQMTDMQGSIGLSNATIKDNKQAAFPTLKFISSRIDLPKDSGRSVLI